MDPFLGQLLLASFNFAPKGFSLASGQLVSIQQNQALFSLLGTQFGGNGNTTFALPDMRGRVPVHQSSLFTIGQQGGEETHTITANETPLHTHLVTAIGSANTTDPSESYLGGNGAMAFGAFTNLAAMNPSVIANSGGSQPHDNRQPFLVMTWVIAVQGIFPSRS